MNIRISFSSMLINTPLVQDMPLLLSFISKYIQHIEGIEKFRRLDYGDLYKLYKYKKSWFFPLDL